MSIPILNNLNLNGNQLIAARLETLGTAPTSGNLKSGRLIYNSGDGIEAPQYYDGDKWITLSRKGYFSDLPIMYIGKTMVTSVEQTTAIVAAGFKTAGGADTSVLTAGGGSALISGLSVGYATSAGDSAKLNGYTGALATGDASADRVLVYKNGNTNINYRSISELSVKYAASAGKVSNELSWSGFSTGSYDGSEAKSISIPTASSFYSDYDGRYLKLVGGTMAAGAKIYFNGGTDAWIEYDSNDGMFKFSKGIYSLGQVCAGGTGTSSGGSGGTDYSRLDKWSDYDSTKAGYVLSALLGNDLNTRVTSLEAGSATSITMGTTGTEYAVTNITKSGTTIACATSRFAPINGSGKIDSQYLPSYVDDVLEGYYYNSKFYSDSGHTTELSGESGKIFVDVSTKKIYRWASGTGYIEISPSPAVYDTTITVNHSVSNGAASRNAQTFTLNQSSAKTITVYDTWRPVVDSLTSTATTSSLSANQGKVLNDKIAAKPAEYRYTIAGSSSNTTRSFTPDHTFTNLPAVSLWDASGNLVLTDIAYSSSTKKLTVTFASAPTTNYTLVAIGN